jgi:hypothetical protein
VELRFGIPDRTAQQAGNLVVFVAIDLVEYKDIPVASRQFFHSASQRDSVDGTGKTIVDLAMLSLGCAFRLADRFIERELPETFLAKAHQDRVDGYAMKPRRNGGISAEAPELTKDLHESILGQIFGLGGVGGHAQANRVNLGLVGVKQGAECVGVTLLG